MRGLGFILAILLVLSGCGLSIPFAEEPKDSPANEQETELVVSAAASLTDVMDELETNFEDQHPHIDLTFNFGGSGNLSRQIQQGAPADVFLSADQKWMNNLEENDLISPQTRINFAHNGLVLIAPAGEATGATFENLESMKDVQLAIGNPESVPVGQYTKESLQTLEQWQHVEGMFVSGKDVRQVVTYVESGNVQLGFVYSSDALQSDKVTVLDNANPDWHSPIVYPGAVTASSDAPEHAETFINYLQSTEAQQIFSDYGFTSGQG
ncbi:molybdate ABC transporter substrate-binding protein [Thalassobacillus sp. CUG 92003]|uniref:molybdate ABC transporter substrate-binding protein n=1 Tax=Thalassobacillus sp. CUG 92003 TaxID=2736641 RepID=UPI00210690A7|nr:molybdate ABC transporter substrate-binding protein [Thalassobacillus sp. CUG 92003]